MGISKDDIPKITLALAAWWKSQGVSPNDAVYVMAAMTGSVTGGVLAENEDDLEKGLDILIEVMENSAFHALEHSSKKVSK